MTVDDEGARPAPLRPAVALERLDELHGVARREGLQHPFELYQRSATSVRVTRTNGAGVADAGEQIRVGREDGLALRVRDQKDGGGSFVATSGCDPQGVGWLVRQASLAYRAPGPCVWRESGHGLRDVVGGSLPAPAELRRWLDEAIESIPDSKDGRFWVEVAVTQESWAATGGLRAVRARRRAWAGADLAVAEGGRSRAPMILAAPDWESLATDGWHNLVLDRRWPPGEAAAPAHGHYPVVFSPEAAATLVRSLTRVIHAAGTEVGLPVGEGWVVADDPLAPGALGGERFDDAGFQTGRRVLADGERAVATFDAPGTWSRGSYRDPPKPRPSFLVVDPPKTPLPSRALVASRVTIHPVTATSWVLDIGGGLLDGGNPGHPVTNLLISVDPESLVRRCMGGYGRPRISWQGVQTPSLIFRDLPV